jgi:hypothetical protein
MTIYVTDNFYHVALVERFAGAAYCISVDKTPAVAGSPTQNILYRLSALNSHAQHWCRFRLDTQAARNEPQHN